MLTNKLSAEIKADESAFLGLRQTPLVIKTPKTTDTTSAQIQELDFIRVFGKKHYKDNNSGDYLTGEYHDFP